MADVKKDMSQEAEYSIKPQAVAPSVDTSQWPLLLKNFDQRKAR
jgi:H/ACA ribonucleoprotein complex subunit 4